jgi:hypothetical protein
MGNANMPVPVSPMLAGAALLTTSNEVDTVSTVNGKKE